MVTNGIRKAGSADAERVHDLLRHAFGDTYLRYTVYQAPESLTYLRQQLGSAPSLASQYYFLGMVGGAVAGFYNAFQKADVFLLNYIAAYAQFRGQGIGRALLEHYETLGSELGCQTLALDVFENNGQVRDWYRRQGYCDQSAHYLVSIAMRSVPAARDAVTYDEVSWRNAHALERAQGFSKLEVRCSGGSVMLGMIDRRICKLLDYSNLARDDAIRMARRVLPEREELILSTDSILREYDVLRGERVVRMSKLARG